MRSETTQIQRGAGERGLRLELFRMPTVAKGLVFALASYALLGGASTLLGWFVNLPRLTDWLGSGISMFANTALAGSCAGGALLLRLRQEVWAKVTALALAATVALIGGATLLEHLAGIDLGIDTLVTVHAWGLRAATTPGRMGPPASVSFALLGIALLLAIGKSSARRAVPALAVLVIAISLLAIAGYLFDADPLFATARLTGIAMQTATIILALGLALLASAPDLEPVATLCRDSAASVLVRRALPVLFLLPIALGWLFIVGRRAQVVDRGAGIAMLVLALVVCFSLLLWWCAAAVETYEKRSRAAERNAALLAAIVEHSDDAILSTDLDGMVLSWNGGAERLYGYAAHEAIGRPISLLRPEGRADEQPEILECIRHGGSLKNYETTRRRKDGTVFDVSLTVSPVKDAQGQVVGISKVARDITDKVRAREILEGTVAQRTASLTEALAQMEEFSYTVSHDLRAPVRAVSGFIETAIEDYGSTMGPELRELLARSRAAAQRMDLLIRDILEYSRVARADLKLAPIALEQFLPGIIRENPELQPPRASVAIRAPLEPVLGHESCLSQAVTNLLRNAVKFVRPGVHPQVELWTERHNGTVRLWIKDNGIGIKPQYHSRLFGLFERAHHSGLYEGTGIGLAIVRKSAEKMGGKVGLQSDGVNGSSFWIELPSVSP